MSYELSFDPDRMQADVIFDFVRSSYWSPNIRREIVDAALRNSLPVGVFELACGVQVGFARAVTDYATFAWIADVFVAPAHRGRGLSKQMLAALLAHPRLQTLRRWALATRDAQSLYRQFGFAPVEADRWMVRRMPTTSWQYADAPPS